MKKGGVYCLIFGIGSFVLPFFGLQFRLLSFMGNNTWILSAILVAIGALLLYLGKDDD